MIRFELYKARKIKKLTQQKVADAIGISRSTYSKIENGLVAPDVKLVEKLCSVVGCSREIFFIN